MKKRSRNSTRTRLQIESQETIKEVHTKSYEVVRLSRVKYKGNPHSFIDRRFFQRGYDEDAEAYYPTRKGVQFREDLLKLVDRKRGQIRSWFFTVDSGKMPV
ncbi:MAG: hypothetical protein HY694_09955 [Deltaproteobacteria bacterium]|nr:hypothetical protein [Deltaproteobacteria bacterium]